MQHCVRHSISWYPPPPPSQRIPAHNTYPSQSSPVTCVPGREVPGQGDDPGEPPTPLCSLTHLGHHGYPLLGKTPPIPDYPAAIFCNMGCFEFQTYCHIYFSRGVEWKSYRLTTEFSWSIMETAFWAYGQPLENSSLFNYLGLHLISIYDNCQKVVANLRKAWSEWEQMSRILEW